jgi:hypothetical protein
MLPGGPFEGIGWQETNGFIMIEKSCHTCKYGIYDNEEKFIQAVTLICDKKAEANPDGSISDPKRYVCNLWEQNDIYKWMRI